MSKKKFELEPIGDRIIVRPDESSEDEQGGIYIPENSKEKSQSGVVMAVGRGKLMVDGSIAKLEVNVGDKIIYSRYGGTEIKIKDDKDQTYLLMTEDDVLCVKHK